MKLILFFVTSLIATPESSGWIQYTKAHKTIESCQKYLKTHEPKIIYGLMKYVGGPMEIKEIKCMTHEEAVKLNTELGH